MRSSLLKTASLSVTVALMLMSCGGGSASDSGVAASAPLATGPAFDPEAPLFTSGTNVFVPENSTDAFHTIIANDPDGQALTTVRLSSGFDSRFFAYDALTSTLSPAGAFDFESPASQAGTNVYNVKLLAEDVQGLQTPHIITVTVTDVNDDNAYGLNPNLPPGQNFDLADWKIQLPINSSGGLTGISTQINEWEMDDYESEYFFTGPDGGMVFICPAVGAKTSANTSYSRTELREMLRRGDTSISTHTGKLPAPDTDTPNGNNWAFSSAPQSAQDSAGGVDGTLKVTMAVNKVTTTGETYQQGRVIIGQIHAADDEPIRLYYRKLPGNTHGSIYAAHEVSGGDEDYYNLIGSRSSSQSNPANGIMLDQIFSYEIDVNGNLMDVEIVKDGAVIASTQIDMNGSGYDVANDYHYFKAGLYHVNNSADLGDDAQVTIYEIENLHDGYPF